MYTSQEVMAATTTMMQMGGSSAGGQSSMVGEHDSYIDSDNTVHFVVAMFVYLFVAVVMVRLLCLDRLQRFAEIYGGVRTPETIARSLRRLPRRRPQRGKGNIDGAWSRINTRR